MSVLNGTRRQNAGGVSKATAFMAKGAELMKNCIGDLTSSAGHFTAHPQEKDPTHQMASPSPKGSS